VASWRVGSRSELWGRCSLWLSCLNYWTKRSGWCLVFFFSSRRRHTSSKRDWSSDVCSSDLECTSIIGTDTCTFIQRSGNFRRKRSEERRVGKEGRSRRAAGHANKKSQQRAPARGAKPGGGTGGSGADEYSEGSGHARPRPL